MTTKFPQIQTTTTQKTNVILPLIFSKQVGLFMEHSDQWCADRDRRRECDEFRSSSKQSVPIPSRNRRAGILRISIDQGTNSSAWGQVRCP